MFGRQNTNPKSTSANDRSSAAAVPWSVRAELTVHRPDETLNSPVTGTGNTVPTPATSGVRMTYSFTPTPVTSGSSYYNNFTPTMAPTAATTYAFQRGNFMFTSTPPPRSLIPVRSNAIPRSTYAQPPPSQYEEQLPSSTNRMNLPDSVLNTGLHSSNSFSRIPVRQPSNDRRCTSTYSIVLSGNTNKDKGPEKAYQQAIQSKLPFPKSWSSYCQQRQQQNSKTPSYQYKAVPELCEDRDSASTEEADSQQFTSHLSTQLSNVSKVGKVATAATTESRDVTTQTTDIEAKLSPVAARRKMIIKKKPTTIGAPAGTFEKDEPKDKNLNRLSRTSTASTKSPASPPTEQLTTVSDSSTTNTSNTKDDSSDKRKRTVHIDVYCTGTDDEDDTSGDDDLSSIDSSCTDEEDNHTQSTVFESTDIRITHTQPKAGVLPRGFQDDNAFLKRASERRCESIKNTPMRMPSLASTKGYESDDVVSSLYPSQFSSYSRIKDFDSSVPWSATSSRSGLALDEFDSASATSWKDTVSDIDSFVHSKTSLTPSDSFEYADSLDQERIRQLETGRWPSKKIDQINNKNKSWESPDAEKKHLLQGGVKKDQANVNLTANWFSESSSESSDSSSESSDSEGEEEAVGWSFVSSEESTSIVQGKLTLPMNSGDARIIDNTTTTKARLASNSPSDHETSLQTELLIKEVKRSIFRDRIGPFGSVSPSPPPSKFQSRMTSPFTTPQGEKTDHIIKASIFGRVVDTFRKPGHHVGPAKNPTCSCEHCRRYFEEQTDGHFRILDTVERRRSSSRTNSSTNS